MKKRQIEILYKILENRGLILEELIKQFKVSRRTIYYDIESINDEIKQYGTIRNINKKLIYVGSNDVYEHFNLKVNTQYDSLDRQKYILKKIFLEDFFTIDEISEELDVSKTTVVNDLTQLKDMLKKSTINLIYDKHYQLDAKEYKIRDFYIKSMYLDQNLLHYNDERILKLNKIAKLYLTDYSIALLSKYLKFLEMRVSKNHIIEKTNIYDDVIYLNYLRKSKEILKIEDKNELKHFVAFIASMTSLKKEKVDKNIDNFVDELIINFEKLSMVSISNKDEFKKDISRHLQSSYFRLKYKFPIYNSIFDDIKKNYSYLFDLVKEALKNTKDTNFSNMRDSEISFLTMYFGSKMETFSNVKNKVIIVCPNGKGISRLIESQLKNYLPTLNVIDIASIQELENFTYNYDYIISTVPIENKTNVIIVNPILSQHDIAKLYNIFLEVNPVINEKNIENIIDIIKENAEIKNEVKLRKNLLEYFIKNNTKKEKQDYIKLSNLITKDKIKTVKRANSWENAIEEASKILIENKSITDKYVRDMIEQIKLFGPYIVLVDGIAMPHAKNNKSVNKIDISYLKLEEPIDLMGKMVDIFIVLSTLDNKKHLKMISTLAEILSDENLIDEFRSGDYLRIKNAIEKIENK